MALNRSEIYSRDGDGTHDNPMFHLITEQYYNLEDKIKKIEKSLINAEIIDEKLLNCKTVEIGTIVDLGITADKEIIKETFQIVDPLESSLSEGKISYETPVGKALLGLKIGDKCKVNDCIYKVISIRIE